MCYSFKRKGHKYVDPERVAALIDAEKRENPASSAAFEYYFNLGAHRDISTVAKQLELQYTIVKYWSHRYKWADRAIYRDKQMAAKLLEARVHAITKMKERFVDVGEELAQMGLDHLRRKIQQARGRGLNDIAAVQMVKLGTAIELRGYDLPESITREELTGKDGQAIEIEAVQAAKDRLIEMLERHAEALGSPPTFAELPEATIEGSASPVDEAI